MKITGFSPIIVSQNAEGIKELFEGLGFEHLHTKSDIEDGNNTNYNLKDANGNRINIATSNKVPKDLTMLSINVDNFDEAYEYFLSKGFVNSRGDKVTETESSISTMLVSPSGFAITLTEHIKN
ncbi:MAG: hypothetical protein IJF94_03660 [Eubacterium sp.]|nr:hypothetical protein [Eubacterium sp.]